MAPLPSANWRTLLGHERLRAMHQHLGKRDSEAEAALAELKKEPPADSPQTLREDVHVVLASVPWRLDSTNDVLRFLSQQSMLPGVLHLLLDGYGSARQPDTSALQELGVKVKVQVTDVAKGAGERTRYAERLPDGLIVLFLDDDLVLRRSYLSRMVRGVEERDAVVSGGGIRQDGVGVFCNASENPFQGEVIYVQCGVLAFRSEWMKGVSSFPLADKMLSRLGHDEVLLSAFFWKSSRPMHRVYAPIWFNNAASDDARALHNVASDRFSMLEEEMRRAVGWPFPRVRA
jgi:hypothetical protein